MYRYEEIRKVHMEITSNCNAACPQCSRNFFGKSLGDNLPLAELTLEDIRHIFPPDFVGRLKLMFMSGTYGDAMVARDTLEVFEYFRECNPDMRLGMHTNGSGRKSEWWRRLAQVVDYCAFGIDGLADTNHLYRRGTYWDKIMESVNSYISAGGCAQWHYIVFRHNEHQVDEAREMARQLGFNEFTAKRTGRFLRHWTENPFSPVLNNDGQLEYLLEMPSDPRYRNETFVELYSDRAAARAHREETPIDCKVAGSHSLFINGEGMVFPCCWTATLYPRQAPMDMAELEHLASQLPGGDITRAKQLRRLQPKGLNEIWRLIDQLPNGKDSINAKRVPLKEIIDGPFFQEMIPKGWEKKPFDEGRLRICAKTCGLKRVKASQNVTMQL